MHRDIYPTPGYLVSFFTGSSGSFLKLIISCFLGNRDIVISHFENGTAHFPQPFPEFDLFYNDERHDLSFIDRDYTVREDRPFLHCEHASPNWEKLFHHFPKLKNIIITLDKRTSGRQILNFEIKNKFMDPKNVDYLKNILRLSKLGSPYPYYAYPYATENLLPDDKRIIKIPYYDIIHKKDSVLSTLSEVTNRPIRNSIVQTYDFYLQAQHDLFPWYDDK